MDMISTSSDVLQRSLIWFNIENCSFDVHLVYFHIQIYDNTRINLAEATRTTCQDFPL